MNYRTIQSSTTSFSYAGNKMAGASGGESFSLDYDLNGNMKNLPTTKTNKTLTYNWDNRETERQHLRPRG